MLFLVGTLLCTRFRNQQSCLRRRLRCNLQFDFIRQVQERTRLEGQTPTTEPSIMEHATIIHGENRNIQRKWLTQLQSYAKCIYVIHSSKSHDTVVLLSRIFINLFCIIYARTSTMRIKNKISLHLLPTTHSTTAYTQLQPQQHNVNF